MTSANPFCRLIEWLHRHCTGAKGAQTEVPIALREASHNLVNEVTRLQGQVFKVRQSADELSDLVEHMQRPHDR